MRAITLSCLLTLALGPAATAQSLVVDGNIETAGQLVSTAAPGVEPLVVSSTTLVRGLNADQIDGMEAASFALETDLQSAEVMLLALQTQIDGLGLAPLRRSGQASCYNNSGNVIDCAVGIGPGQDGARQLGVTWPVPRLTNNGDGTVTDHLTGLVWLENATCSSSRLDWAEALAFANTLFDGSTAHDGGDCNLSDGSVAGQWRLPNVMEMQSLMHYGFGDPAIPDTAGTGQWTEGDPFIDVRSDFYWTSTSWAYSGSYAWLVYTFDGQVRNASKPGVWRAWPVRDVD